MMYYNLELSSEPKIIGVRNGVYQVELIEEMYDKSFFQKFNDYFHGEDLFSKMELNPSEIHFHFKKFKTAKETNFMSFCPAFNNCLFVINESAIEVLEKFKIQSYQLFPTTLYDKNNEILNCTYKMFFSVLQDWNVIDFSKTVFSSGGIGDKPLEYYNYSNHHELTSTNPLARLVKLSLNSEFDRELDLFRTRLGRVFVSSRLKNALEEAKVTGLEFRNKVEVVV